MNTELEILLIFIGIVFSAFFSGAEAALMSIPVDRTKQLIEQGDSRGRAFEFLVQKSNEILSTILIGNNFVNSMIASLTTSMASRYFNDDILAISVGIATLLILIFGEVLPKTFARTRSEQIAYPSILILRIFYYLFYPLVQFFMFVVHTVLGKNATINGRIVTSDDIEFLVNKAEQENSIDSKQLDLLSSILEFPSIKVKDIMVPRQNIEAIQRDSNFDQIIEMIKDVAHSRYPVYGEDLDDTIGFLHVKDLAFVPPQQREKFDVMNYVKPPFFVYEHMKIQAVFDHMNRKKVHLALVKDENGIVVGIITLEDIMEEIFGEIQDEHDDEDDGVPGLETEEGVLVPASISLRDLYNEYDIKIPLNDNYSTLTGFILENLGNNFPRKGNIIFWDGYSFELIRVKNYVIKEVKIKSVSGEQHLFRKGEENSDIIDEETEKN